MFHSIIFRPALRPTIRAQSRTAPSRRKWSLGALALGALLAMQTIAPAEAQAQVGRAQFARKPGAAVAPQLTPPHTIPGKLLADPVTRQTNELIILLNYDNIGRLSQLAPGIAARGPGPMSAPDIERGFMYAVQTRNPNQRRRKRDDSGRAIGHAISEP